MPLKPSSGAAVGSGYRSRPADAVLQADGGRRTLTREDRMPLTMHLDCCEQGPTDRRAKRETLGGVKWTPAFANWLNEPFHDEAVLERQIRARPALWWRSPYLVGALERHFAPELVQAVVRLHTLQDRYEAWNANSLNAGDPEAALREATSLRRQLKATAATLADHQGRPRDVDWLERQAQRLTSFAGRTYYSAFRDGRSSAQSA